MFRILFTFACLLITLYFFCATAWHMRLAAHGLVDRDEHYRVDKIATWFSLIANGFAVIFFTVILLSKGNIL